MNQNRFFKIFSVVLFILIIILFMLFFSRYGKITHELIPTGNIDIFNIEVNCVCTNDNCTVTDPEGNVIPVYNEIEDENVIGNVFVDDKGGNYLYQQRLKIFENPAYEFTNKIAPGSTNVYHFVVHNSTNIELKYKVKMYEESEYKINMVYRLKRNNNYVLGDENNWVTARELETQFKNLDKSKSDNYSLEWMWKYEGDDESDSIAGKNMESEYKLNIRVFFEAVTNV